MKTYLLIFAFVIAFPFSASAHDMAAMMPKMTSKTVVAGGTGVSGSFSLTDQNGKAVTDKDFAGKYRLVYFGFTNCPDVCPLDLKKMADALKMLPDAQAGKVAPIFITVDPEHDKPAVMKDYVAQFDKRITGLTGTDDQIAQAENSYKVYAAKNEDGKSTAVSHSAYTYLMGPDGSFMDLFSQEDSAKAMAEKLKTLVQ